MNSDPKTPGFPSARCWMPAVALRLNPLGFLTRLAHDYGDIVRFEGGGRNLFLLNHPDLIRDVLVTHDRKFSKGRGLEVAKRLLGEGLLTSEGELHRRQRRLAQPSFHRGRIAAYSEVMTEYTLRAQERWRDGAALDVAHEMRRLTLAIAGKTLFDADMESKTDEISGALTEVMQLYNWAMLPFAPKLEPLFFPLTRRFERARDRLDATIHQVIRKRRASGKDHGDLLSMLMLARDEEGDSGTMTDLQLRDEAMTIFLAGHETTASALAWTWYLLSQHPEAEAALHRELDSVLGGATPAIEDVPQLRYTRRVFSESLRLYPPAWVVARRALEDCPIRGGVLPAGSTVLLSQWVTHRDARFFPDPLRFDPERWAPEEAQTRSRFTYFPFGGGSRVCIGEQFAWTEGILVLAAIACRWRLSLLPGRRVLPQPLITLRPKNEVRMTLQRRTAAKVSAARLGTRDAGPAAP